MANMTTIILTDEVFFNEEVRKLRNQRKLSRLINKLIMEHINIKKESISGEIDDIDEELMQLQIKAARLKDKKEEIKKKEEENAPRQFGSHLYVTKTKRNQ